MDCNPNNNANPNTYAIFKYTNITSSYYVLNYEMELWYNGNLMEQVKNDAGEEWSRGI